MRSTHFVQAKPLLLVSLDQQIRALGGRGFNSDVLRQSMQGSFSQLFTFQTPDGVKTLVTRNETQVGYIDGQHVMYLGDTGEYVLTTLHHIPKPPYKLCHIRTIGYSFDEALLALKKEFPNRLAWDLRDPTAGEPAQIEEDAFPGVTRSDIFEVNMNEVLAADHDASQECAEWSWIEQNASFSHCQNGDSPGVWEFVINLAREFDDIPERLQPIVRQAKKEKADYMIFY